MSLQEIEGTWEEIESHKAELVGHQLRVTVLSENPVSDEQKTVEATTAPAKVLRGRGMFAGILSTEDYFRERREDAEREDRNL